jgi:pimeloyl-ACP methyl ester carboxylesterase
MRPEPADLTVTTEPLVTRDGWRLLVRRLRPREVDPGLPPVLCVHGLCNTAWPFYGGPGGGIAGALAAAGRDVWAVELRGSEGTHHPRHPTRVRVQDKALLDVPAAIHHVLQATGWRHLDGVGHSLGGVMLYLQAARPDCRIRRAVTLSAPLAMDRGALPSLLRTRAARAVAGRLGRVPMRDVTAAFERVIRQSWMGVHFEPALMDEDGFRGFLARGVGDTFGSELVDLIDWLRAADHRVFLPEAAHGEMKRLPFPTRFVVGASDALTTPGAVRDTFDRIAGPCDDLHVLSRAAGYRGDYRHTDVLMGRYVQDEVVPLIGDWLGRHREAVAVAPVPRPAWRALAG